MINTAVHIDDRQFEGELEKRGKHARPWGKKTAPAQDKYGLTPMEIDATTPQATKKKETQKCYNCQKVGHLAANCQSKKKKEGKGKQLNATGAWKGKGIQEPPRAPRGTLPMNRSEATLLGQEDNLRQHIERLENDLQRSLEDLHAIQDQIDKVHWEDDLISEFDTTDYKIDITGMPPVPETPLLRRQDATLSEDGEARVTRWVDDTISISQPRDIAAQVDHHQATTPACGRPYWKGCKDHHCKEHLLEKRRRHYFPGPEYHKKAWSIKHQLSQQGKEHDDCREDAWELCFTEKCERHAAERQAQGLGCSKN